MRRALPIVLLALMACSPGAALAAAWEAAEIRPVSGRIVPLTSVIRDQYRETEVIETGTERIVAVPSDLLFAFDSAVIGSEGTATLRDLATQLTGGSVTVVGHTDARGGEAYNRRLSARRASAVADILRPLVDGVQVRTRAMGEGDAVASNRTAAGRRRNRRVELVVPRSTDGHAVSAG